jgi:putative glutathione S-transferase
MGLLVDGSWHDRWYDTKSTAGKFARSESQFRHWVTRDGSAGPSGDRGFAAESGRYHLYVSLACPWAHRVLILRLLKGLEAHIDVSVVHPYMAEHGWTFDAAPGVVADPIRGARFMHEIYTAAQPDYSGRVTVPVLWDRERSTIVSNESSELLRMFNSAFDDLPGVDTGHDFHPEALREEIEEVNARVYSGVNNGVYESGFSTTQPAYDEAVARVFATLDWLEDRLETRRYLVGPLPTEADIRLLATLLRFDPVYHGHFKCNRRRLIDYPNLWGYTRELYQVPAVRETTDFNHIVEHYYRSHELINPSRIVPTGPKLDFESPHGRERLEGAPPWQ